MEKAQEELTANSLETHGGDYVKKKNPAGG